MRVTTPEAWLNRRRAGRRRDHTGQGPKDK